MENNTELPPNANGLTRREANQIILLTSLGLISAYISACTGLENGSNSVKYDLKVDYPEMETRKINQEITVRTRFSNTTAVNFTDANIDKEKLSSLINEIEEIASQNASERYKISLRPNNEHLIFVINPNDPQPFWNKIQDSEDVTLTGNPIIPTHSVVTISDTDQNQTINSLRSTEDLAIEVCQSIIEVGGTDLHPQEMYCNSLGMMITFKSLKNLNYEDMAGIHLGFDPTKQITEEEYSRLTPSGIVIKLGN